MFNNYISLIYIVHILLSLVNAAYKVLANIVMKHLKPVIEDNVGVYQSCFRKNKTKEDQIFTIRQLLEKYSGFNREFHYLFTNFRQAYHITLGKIRRQQWNSLVVNEN